MKFCLFGFRTGTVVSRFFTPAVEMKFCESRIGGRIAFPDRRDGVGSCSVGGR
jgi:hypothetical protein